MADSGLKELLVVIYASNAVDNMLTDKAISRAVRGHADEHADVHTSFKLGKHVIRRSDRY